MQAQHGARFIVDYVFVISRKQKGCHRAVGTSCWFYNKRNIPFVRGLIEIVKLLFRKFGVSLEIEIGALGNALEFTPAPWKLKFNIARTGGIMLEFV